MASDQRLIRTGGSRLKHTPPFDGFRGVGVLIVVFYHAELLLRMSGALIVIDWFFIASGFLITMIILDEREATGTNSLRRFYERRILRLFPAMYAMIGTFTVLMLVLTGVSSDIRDKLGNWWIDALGAATYSYYLVAAIIPGKVTGAIGHTWSLSLEEQFYFVWPVVLIFVLNKARRTSDRNLIIALITFIATMFALRMGLHYVARVATEGEPLGTIRFVDKENPTFAGILYRIAGVRPDMIAFGCLLAFVYKYLPDPLSKRASRTLTVMGVVGAVTMFVYMFVANRYQGLRVFGRGVFDLIGGPAYNVTLVLMGFFILDLYVHPDGPLARVLSFKPLTWLGVRSYGIYLWHILPILPFVPVLQSSWGVKKLILGLIAGSAGIAAGIGSFRFIERPFLRLKETKFRRPHEETGAGRDGVPDKPVQRSA